MLQTMTHPPSLHQEVGMEHYPEENENQGPMKQLLTLRNDIIHNDDEDENEAIFLTSREYEDAETESLVMTLASENGSFASMAAEFASSMRTCRSHSSMAGAAEGRNHNHASRSFQPLASAKGSRSMMPLYSHYAKSPLSPKIEFSPHTVIVSGSEFGDMHSDDVSTYSGNNSHMAEHDNSISSTSPPKKTHAPKNPILRLITFISKSQEQLRYKAYHKHLEELRKIVKQARIEAVEGSTDEANRNRAKSIENLGELGVALFSPLDAAFETDFGVLATTEDEYMLPIGNEDGNHDESSSEGSAEEEITVQVRPEDEQHLKSSPRILSLDMMQQISDCALPSTITMKRWVRLYSVSRDGDSFGTFLRNVKGHSHTVLAVQTCRGEIVGGFADQPWEQQKNVQDGSSYYGTGSSFLFHVKEGSRDKKGRHRNSAFCPLPIFEESFRVDEEDDLDLISATAKAFSNSPTSVVKTGEECPNHGCSKNKDRVIIHKWQGKNNYNQLCHTREGRLAMGGGGGATFGFCLQDFFGHGSTGACETYGTTGPLTQHEHFDVVDFEVYGFEYAW